MGLKTPFPRGVNIIALFLGSDLNVPPVVKYLGPRDN